MEAVINFLIEHQCPQCGAPATLEETDRLFACQYCRVNSYLITDGFFRYVLPHPATDNSEVIFFPYWRFKGMLFFCGPAGIKDRFVDVSHQAISCDYFPISVGLRSQAMKLRFVTGDTEGRFLRPRESFKNFSDNFGQRFGRSLPKPILHQAHVGETLSLIYSPFFIRDKLYDAILDEPVSQVLPQDFNIEEFEAESPQGHIRFVATLCPKCGWNLTGERDALVLSCKNCNSSWYPVGKKLKQLTFAMMPGEGENTVYLPFWRIRPAISGVDLNSYADLIRIANLAMVAKNEWSDVPFRFWIPAFKVRPRIFLRLASHITLSQPNQALINKLPDAGVHPTTLPIQEAIETLMITLADFIKPRSTFIDKHQDIQIKAKSFTLVYIPFNEGHHEFIQPDYQLAINKNVMALSTNL